MTLLISHGTTGKAGAERCCTTSTTCLSLSLDRQNSPPTLWRDFLDYSLPTSDICPHKVVRLCYRANPYSPLQNPFASSVFENSFPVVIRTMSMLMDPEAYKNLRLWIYVSHICENRMLTESFSASTLLFVERKIQHVGHQRTGASLALSVKCRNCPSSWISPDLSVISLGTFFIDLPRCKLLYFYSNWSLSLSLL